MFALKNNHVKMAVNVKTRTKVISADVRLDLPERIANVVSLIIRLKLYRRSSLTHIYRVFYILLSLGFENTR